jgi:hypothetical protein
VADDVAYRKCPAKHADQPGEHRVLRGGVGGVIGPFELDADGEVVAAFPALPGGYSGVPGPLEAADKLDELAVAPDQEVCRDLDARNGRVIRVGARIEPVGE